MRRKLHGSLHFVLGADDPEMDFIRKLIIAAGHTFENAYDDKARRVTSSTAYNAEPMSTWINSTLVECDSSPPSKLPRADHHRPGDPGFGRPPEEFWSASSLGQVFDIIAANEFVRLFHPELLFGPSDKGEPGCTECGTMYICLLAATGDLFGMCDRCNRIDRIGDLPLLFIAAADHCLAAAHAGKCPGVDRYEFRAWRQETRARWLMQGPGQGRDVARKAIIHVYGSDPETHAGWIDAIAATHQHSERLLLAAPQISIGDTTVYDTRGISIPELPEVLSILGKCAIYRMDPLPDQDQRVKIGIIGGGEGSVPGPEPIKAFLDHWATEHGLVDLYGDPARGYAGGYAVI